LDERFLFLDEPQTETLLSMVEVVRICEAALTEMGRKVATLSVPQAMFLEGDKTAPTLFKVKGGYMPSLDACGFRVVGDVGVDGAAGESHFCYLLDPQTGRPRALVAHTALHRMRTAACGLIALRALTASNTETFALIGAGKIGRHFARGFGEMFPGKRLLIASRRPETAAQLAGEAASASACIVATESVSAALREAQSVVALTSSSVPLFSADEIRPGMTVIGMGEHHELPAGLLHSADRFVVDDVGFASVLGSLAAWIKTGQVSKDDAAKRVDATLGSIIAGVETGRRTDSEMILCIVQGLSIADLALSELCRRKALGLPVSDPMRSN
jgi:ornithine cyclodeaminase/alanine dehydrogenase-like protein (mu-crystallin family)